MRISLFCSDTSANLRLIEEDKQRQLAEMKVSLWSWMGGGSAPKPEEKPAVQK